MSGPRLPPTCAACSTYCQPRKQAAPRTSSATHGPGKWENCWRFWSHTFRTQHPAQEQLQRLTQQLQQGRVAARSKRQALAERQRAVSVTWWSGWTLWPSTSTPTQPGAAFWRMTWHTWQRWGAGKPAALALKRWSKNCQHCNTRGLITDIRWGVAWSLHAIAHRDCVLHLMACALQVVAATDRTLFCLDPDCTSLTRIWCLYEVSSNS